MPVVSQPPATIGTFRRRCSRWVGCQFEHPDRPSHHAENHWADDPGEREVIVPLRLNDRPADRHGDPVTVTPAVHPADQIARSSLGEPFTNIGE